MKKCVIINSFADTFEKKSILYNTIKSANQLDYDIILSSNYPLDPEIQKLCTHTIYNHKNETLSIIDGLRNNFNVTPSSFFRTFDGRFNFRYINFIGRSYILSILHSLLSSYSLAKSLNYTHAHFITQDIIIPPNFKSEFLRVEDIVDKNNYMGYFERNSNTGNYYGIDCFYWYSNIDWFINSFLSHINDNGFLNTIRDCYNLEDYLWNRLQKDIHHVIIEFRPQEKVISFLPLLVIDNPSTTNTSYLFSLIWMEEYNTFYWFLRNESNEIGDSVILIGNGIKSEKIHVTAHPNGNYIDLCKMEFTDILHVILYINGKEQLNFLFDNELLEKYKKIPK